MNASEKKTLKSRGLLLLLIIMVPLALFGLLYWSSLPVTSTFWYASTMASLKAHSGNFGHFPDKIPPEARNAHFYFDDGGFHGDYTAELCFELPADQVAALYQDCVAKGTKFVRPNTAGFFPPGEQIILMSSVTEVTGGFQTYNSDFEYTTFEPYRGMAINRKSHQVLYWAFSL